MQEELTVRVEHPELPAIRWNEAEVQQNLTEMLAAYTGRVYTPDTIKDAKADRAAVNKLDKQLSDAARSASCLSCRSASSTALTCWSMAPETALHWVCICLVLCKNSSSGFM